MRNKNDLTKKVSVAENELNDLNDALKDEEANKEKLLKQKSVLEASINELNKELDNCKNTINRLEKEKAGLLRDMQDQEAR